MREAIGTPKKCNNLPGYFKAGDLKIKTEKDIAEGFNLFFSTVGTKLNRDLKKGEKSYKSYLRQATSRFKLKKWRLRTLLRLSVL